MTVLSILLVALAAAAVLSTVYVLYGNMTLSVAVHAVGDTSDALRRAIYGVADRSDAQWTKAFIGLAAALLSVGIVLVSVVPFAVMACVPAAALSAHAAGRQCRLAEEFRKLTGLTPSEASRRVTEVVAS